MDNDKLRRGKPSTHVKFGEASAVLAGNSLLTLAFEIIADKKYSINPKVKNEIIRSLAYCSGHTGIAGGQELDLKFDFLVTRAVAKMPKIINWSRSKFNLESNNEIKNGVIALKGGDINEELSSINNSTILPIEEILDNQYFIDKKIVYVPI